MSIKYKGQQVSGGQGPKGDPGPRGDTGPQGEPGKDATINGQNTLEIVAGENVTIDQKDGVLTIGAVGGSTEEVYSTEETRIGTWIDGKPLYRRVLLAVTPSSSGWHYDWYVDNHIENIAFVYGYAKIDVDSHIPVNSEHDFRVWAKVNTLRCYVESGTANLNATIILEYTKTTDPSTSEQAAVLTSQVEFPKTVSVDPSNDALDSSVTVTFPSAAAAASASASSASVRFPATHAAASASSVKFNL